MWSLTVNFILAHSSFVLWGLQLKKSTFHLKFRWQKNHDGWQQTISPSQPHQSGPELFCSFIGKEKQTSRQPAEKSQYRQFKAGLGSGSSPPRPLKWKFRNSRLLFEWKAAIFLTLVSVLPKEASCHQWCKVRHSTFRRRWLIFLIVTTISQPWP